MWKEILKRLIKWFRLLWKTKPIASPIPTSYCLKVLNDSPSSLADMTIYHIENRGKPISAELLCPCGCGDRIELSLMLQNRPRWDISINAEGLPTIYPSVWRTEGCKSHFILKDGQVFFVNERY